MDEIELSLVLANAIENALHALAALPEGEKRRLRVVCRFGESFALEIANPYAGEVLMGADGVPIASRSGHGMGMVSIRMFAEKYQALLDCSAENGVFRLRLVIPRLTAAGAAEKDEKNARGGVRA